MRGNFNFFTDLHYCLSWLTIKVDWKLQLGKEFYNQWRHCKIKNCKMNFDKQTYNMVLIRCWSRKFEIQYEKNAFIKIWKLIRKTLPSTDIPFDLSNCKRCDQASQWSSTLKVFVQLFELFLLWTINSLLYLCLLSWTNISLCSRPYSFKSASKISQLGDTS